MSTPPDNLDTRVCSLEDKKKCKAVSGLKVEATQNLVIKYWNSLLHTDESSLLCSYAPLRIMSNILEIVHNQVKKHVFMFYQCGFKWLIYILFTSQR